VGHSHLDGAAAAEEGDKEDDAADHHEEDGRVEELVAQEVQVLTDQGTADELS
jgi:hypothetical protein